MLKRPNRRSLLRTGTAIGAVFLFSSSLAQADISAARCDVPAGSGVFQTSVSVWVNGVRTNIPVGERGLTSAIAFSPSAMLDWVRSEFGTEGGGNVGFNDCMGSLQTPSADPVEIDSSDTPPPPPPPSSGKKGECGPCGCIARCG